MDNNSKEHIEEKEGSETGVCIKAPEWAEHARFTDEDEPCDDSRAGKI